MIVLIDHDDDLVTVAEPTDANLDATPVWVATRWRVLAAPSHTSNASRIGEAR